MLATVSGLLPRRVVMPQDAANARAARLVSSARNSCTLRVPASSPTSSVTPGWSGLAAVPAAVR